MHQKAALNPQIAALNRLGQSIWYDNLSRDVLQSGELAGYVGQGISGLTSNPAIFKNAIADTGHYDSVMRAMAAEGLSSEQICEALMIEDVGQAADLLRPDAPVRPLQAIVEHQRTLLLLHQYLRTAGLAP